VRGGICEIEGVPGQSTGVVQARARYPTPLILRSYREGDQFGPIAGARPGAEANLFHQQGIAEARGETPGLRQSSLSSGILSEKTPPLLPQLYCDSNDRPSNPQGPAKARCSGQNGTIGGRTV